MKMIVIFLLIISLYLPMHAMEQQVRSHAIEKKTEKQLVCFPVYSSDGKTDVPLRLIRQSSELYEQYCSNLINGKKIVLHTSIAKQGLQLYVDAFVKSQHQLGKYCKKLNSKDTRLLINVTAELKSPLSLIKLLTLYIQSEIIKKYIFPNIMNSASECTRYNKIRLNLPGLLEDLPSKKLFIPSNEWMHAYEGDGTYHIVPSSVEKNSRALWEGLYCKRSELMISNNRQTVDFKFSGAHGYYAVGSVLPENHSSGEEECALLSEAIYIASSNGSARVVSMPNSIAKLVFSRDGKLLVMGSRGARSIVTYILLGTIKGGSFFFSGGVTALCFNYQSTMLAIGLDCNGKNLCLQRIKSDFLVDDNTKISMKCLGGHSAGVNIVQFSPDDQRLATCSYDQKYDKSKIILWDVADWHDTNQMRSRDLRGRILKLLFSPAGDRIVAVTNYGECFVIDGCTGELIHCHHYRCGHEDNDCPGIVFSDDSRLFMTMAFYGVCKHSRTSNFKLWDAKIGEKIAELSPKSNNSYAGGFTPDLQFIIDANVKYIDKGQINSTRLYSVQDAQEIKAVADYTSDDLMAAYVVWRSCKAAENNEKAHFYEPRLRGIAKKLPHQLTDIIAKSFKK